MSVIANAVKHGAGTPVRVELRCDGPDAVLTVHDDGPGFDVEAMIRTPPAAHFGMRLLRDAVIESGVTARLTVGSGPGLGTTWRLAVDEPVASNPPH